MKTTPWLLFLLLLASTLAVQAQGPDKSRPQLLGSNSEGFRFMVGFMQNETYELPYCGRAPATLVISVASRFDANVTVNFPDGITLDTAVAAYRVLMISVPEELECYGEGVFRNGIEVVSSRPISVSCYNSRLTTSDGYLALPINSWGKEYVAACYYVDHYTGDDSTWQGYCLELPRPGELAVIAAEDFTTVTVYPKVSTLRGAMPNVPYVKVLRKGEIFQVQDGGTVRRSRFSPGTDLTGTRVIADKPVGLLSGHVRTAVITDYETKDHLIEMIPPVNTLGKRHLVAPFGGRLGGDVVRVISVNDNTQITLTNVSAGNIVRALPRRGDFMDFDLFEASVITTNEPVLVVQYSRSTEADPRNVGRRDPVINFDPDMVVVTPEEQFVNAAVFQTLPNNNGQFSHHYVTLIGEKVGFSNITVDGKKILTYDSVSWGDIPSVPYVWATLEIADNRTHVVSGNALFGGYIYGLGHFDSYAWPVGSGLRHKDIIDSDPPTISARPICGGYEVTAVDSGAGQNGLAAVFLDTTVSRNAMLRTPSISIRGDEFMSVIVQAIDPTQTAFARVVARDLDGNQTYIDITVDPRTIALSDRAIDFGMVIRGTTYTRSFTIDNSGADPLQVDSLGLRIGRYFTLDKVYRNLVIAPGGQLAATVRFRIDAELSVTDTLIAVVDCQEYRIPLSARSNVPQIATHDLDFGDLRVGRQRTMQLAVWNPGIAVLRIDSLTVLASAFSVSGLPAFPVNVAPGDTTWLNVTFRPLSTGPASGIIRFYSNVVDSVAISNLVGVGIYPQLTIDGYDYGMIQIGDTNCSWIRILNTGTDTATVTGVEMVDPTGFVADATPFPSRLAPGDSLFVRICFAPGEERSYSTEISPLNEDDLKAVNTLKGRGYQLIASLSGGDMGRRWIGTTFDSVVYVTNYGTEPIEVTRVYIEGGDDGDFRVDPLNQPFTLAPGARQSVGVHFSPLLPGHRSCQIHALTSSRQRPVIDSVLWGFGLMAMTTARLDLDSSLAYSCRQRHGSVTIYNDGNTPLTIQSVSSTSNPAVLTVNVPPAGYQIAVGDSIVLDLTIDFGGFVGTTTATITWSFVELPSTPGSYSFSVASAPQIYEIAAEAPARVGIGDTMLLVVKVDTATWRIVRESALRLDVRFSPSIFLFDNTAWQKVDDGTSEWKAVSAVLEEPGHVVVLLEPRAGAPLAITGAKLPPLPFRALLGDSERDTFNVSLTATANSCSFPALAAAPVLVDSICGLSERLFQFTGPMFALRQNQPNPVHDAATISFTLPMESGTRLELFAADGKLVMTVVDAVLTSGEYTVPVDVSTLSSGSYYYRLTSGSFSASRRMEIAR